MKSVQLFFISFLWAALTTGAGAATCLQVVNASEAGFYGGAPDYTYSVGPYLVGQFSYLNNAEVHNWFVFPLPAFPAALERAELRIYAGAVSTLDPSEAYELHNVITPVASLINHTGNSTNIYNDLGDGPVYGSAVISQPDTSSSQNFGAIVSLPFTAAGISALTAAAGQQFAVGGKVITLDNDPATVEGLFLNLSRGVPPVQLLLFFSDSGPPQAQMLTSPSAQQLLAGTRLSVSGAACGQQPITLQWLKDGAPVPGATNAVLQINPVAVSDSGNYTLRASNSLATTASSIMSVAVQPLVIVSQPQTVVTYEPNSVSFYVGVSSYLPVSFQWRKDGVNLPGQIYQFLSLYSTSPDDNGNYDAVVSNSAGSVTSAVARLTVQLRPPVFYSTPSDTDVAVKTQLILWSAASGSPPLFYQWLKDGQIVPGANSNVFHVPVTEFTDAGNYQVVVTNAAGAITSAVARVHVVNLVLSGPNDATVFFGATAALYVYPQSGTPVSYEWYFNGNRVPDETNSVLRLGPVDFSVVGEYFVIGANAYGSLTSRVATLTVITQAPSAYLYSSTPLPARIGDNVLLYVSVSGGPIPTIQWRRNGIDLPGETNTYLSMNNVNTNQSGDYAVFATNIYGAVTSAPVHVDVIGTAPVFVAVPGVSNAVAESIVVLRARALGGPPPTYQWRRNGSDLPGETNAMLILPHVTTGDSGAYEIVASNDAGAAHYVHTLNVRAATGLDRWNWRLPHPQGSRLKDIAFGNGRYVAVGKAGNIATSPDGINWTNVLIEADCDLSTVAYGNGLFVTAGEIMAPTLFTTNVYYYPSWTTALVLVSSNGLDWTVGRAPADSILPDITFGNGTFVVGSSAYPGPFNYTSTDGLHWTPHKLGNFNAWQVAWGGGRFVAVYGLTLFHSEDGATWTLATNSPFGGSIGGLTYGNGQFVAYNGAGSALTSPDGISWSEHLVPNANVQALAGGGGKFVAALQNPVGSVLVSDDTVNWTQIDTGAGQEIEGVIYTDHFVAVGEAGTIVSSADGNAWSPSIAANRIDYYGLAQRNSMVVAAGDKGTILTSTDGRNWTTRSTPTTRNLHAAHSANGLFVAGGRAGALITSPTGVNWTSRNSGTTNYIERIHWANGRWVAVGEHGDFTTSTDGVTWTAGNTGLPFTDHEGVIYGDGVWIAAGGYFQNPATESRAVSTLYSSVDGLNWTHLPFDAGVRLRDITYGNGRFVAVANDGLIAVSTNGSAWILISLGGIAPVVDNYRRVHYANGRFVIAGNSGQMLSAIFPEDYKSWVSHRSRTSQNVHDVLGFADGTFLAVGNNGMILQSGDTRPRFLSISLRGGNAVLEFDPGLVSGYLNIEASADLQSWGTVANHASSPAEISSAPPLRFFRLAAP
jgi:hypothetical protein